MALTSRLDNYTNTSTVHHNSLPNSIYDGTYQKILTHTEYDTIGSANTYTTTFPNPPSLYVDGEIVFKGENLSDIIKEIRDALLLLKRDRLREEKYAELKEAAENYLSVLNKLKAIEAITGEDAVE